MSIITCGKNIRFAFPYLFLVAKNVDMIVSKIKLIIVIATDYLMWLVR